MQRKRILVAEDDRNTLKLISYLLTSEGYEVDTVTDGREALKKVNATHPDLVIMDATLRYGDGFALCLELKRNGRNGIKNNGRRKEILVILTSAADVDCRRNSRQWKAISEADDFISKPFEPERLTESVDRLLR